MVDASGQTVEGGPGNPLFEKAARAHTKMIHTYINEIQTLRQKREDMLQQQLVESQQQLPEQPLRGRALPGFGPTADATATEDKATEEKVTPGEKTDT